MHTDNFNCEDTDNAEQCTPLPKNNRHSDRNLYTKEGKKSAYRPGAFICIQGVQN